MDQSNIKKQDMKVSPQVKPQHRFNNFFKVLAIITMPIEVRGSKSLKLTKWESLEPRKGAFFFGTNMGFPSLAELYKQQGVYQDVCGTMNSTLIHCNQRDELFSTAATLGQVI